VNQRHSDQTSSADETPPADPLRLTITEPARSANTLSGVIECGVLAVGDEILISPSNRAAAVVALADAASGATVDRARAGMRVTVSLDRAAQAEAGELVSHHATPPLESDVFRVRLAWSGAAPLIVPAGLSLRLASSVTPEPVTVERIERIVEPSQADEPGEVPRSALADVIVRAGRVVAFDPGESGLATGRVTLLDGATVVGTGGIDMAGYADQRALITRRATNVSEVEYRIDRAMRSARNGHAGGVLWLTGLSGAGKTTLAVELERDLFDRGYQTYILDGDNLRHGLNANLGFSPEDRAENIRRVGAVAALFAEAGFIVISAFISPYRSDRERARLGTADEFHEIYVKASLATCERRDTKGLYKKARAGEIADFTGISAPYEAPEACELVIDTDRLSIAQSIERISSYARREFPFTNS
jgi:bifunctional enzyme CysN/CysC